MEQQEQIISERSEDQESITEAFSRYKVLFIERTKKDGPFAIYTISNDGFKLLQDLTYNQLCVWNANIKKLMLLGEIRKGRDCFRGEYFYHVASSNGW